MVKKRTEKLTKAQNEWKERVLMQRVLKEQKEQVALMQAILDELRGQG